MHTHARTFLSVITTLTCTLAIHAQVAFAPVFSNNMVVQRNRNVAVWGTAPTGETVTVTMNGQTLAAKSAGGRWSILLKSMKAGGPYTLTATGTTNTVKFSNVMVGEVWLCSGQSNMVWQLRRTTNGAAALLTAAKQNVRFFVAPNGVPTGAGWQTSSSSNLAVFSGVAFYFGRDLAKNLGVTVGLIQSAVGGTRVSLWRRGGTWHTNRIKPLVPFGMRGAIWYQGESDANSARSLDYASRFQSMIREWREDWKQGDFPFLFVQLPRYTRWSPYWMYIREAQLQALGSQSTGMAVTTDVAYTGGIHPATKLPIGQRLALAARKIAYGQSLVHSGPMFDPKQSSIVGDKFVCGFNHVGSGLIVGSSTLGGFEIAASNLVFVKASASISQNKVLVSAATVKSPVAVRYNWSLNAPGRLANKEGLPAAPFRSYATYWSYGSGCGTSPRPTLRATLLPRISRPFEIRLDHLEAGKPGLLFTGVSDRIWSGQPLPLDLTSIGMTGCRLFAAGDVQIGFSANARGGFDFRFAVPNLATLLGAEFFNQALVTRSGGNPLGVVVTNAGRGRIGPR